MRSSFLIFVMMLLSGLGLADASPPAAAQTDTFIVRVTGTEPWLHQLAAAARKCGYPNAKVTTWSTRTKLVELPSEILPNGGSPIECVMNWVHAHPNEEFGFIGNAAR